MASHYFSWRLANHNVGRRGQGFAEQQGGPGYEDGPPRYAEETISDDVERLDPSLSPPPETL